MKNKLKLISRILLIAFITIQFFRPKKNVSAEIGPKDITTLYPVEGQVKTILAKACNDCHTNNTNYPWYSNIQPVAWWLADHIEEGKQHLNFSEFAGYSLRKQFHKLEEVVEQVKEKEMPLNSYTWVHRDANLTQEERVALTGWAMSLQDSMKAHYPIDSLVRPKK